MTWLLLWFWEISFRVLCQTLTLYLQFVEDDYYSNQIYAVANFYSGKFYGNPNNVRVNTIIPN